VVHICNSVSIETVTRALEVCSVVTRIRYQMFLRQQVF